MKQEEYCGTMPACFEKGLPKCPAVAVIPSTTLETTDGIKQLSNTVVRVLSNNTLYYVDDKHRITEIGSYPVTRDNYDFGTNPEGFANKFVLDYANGIFAFYDTAGQIFYIQNNIQAQVNAKLDEMLEDGTLQTLVDNYFANLDIREENQQ